MIQDVIVFLALIFVVTFWSIKLIKIARNKNKRKNILSKEQDIFKNRMKNINVCKK